MNRTTSVWFAVPRFELGRALRLRFGWFLFCVVPVPAGSLARRAPPAVRSLGSVSVQVRFIYPIAKQIGQPAPPSNALLGNNS